MAAVSTPPAISAPASTLAGYRWRKRVVLVFATAPGDPRLAQQRRTLREMAQGGDGRDLALVAVEGERVTGAVESADSLRRQWRTPPGAFRAILIGKDGGVKLSERMPIAAERLAATIDAMPMRRSEMRGER